MRALVVAILCFAAVPASAETVAGRGGLPVCNTKAELSELVKSIQAEDHAWTDAVANVCFFVEAGTRVAIIAEEPETLPLGGRMVKIRALYEDSSRTGYAARNLIVDR